MVTFTVIGIVVFYFSLQRQEKKVEKVIDSIIDKPNALTPEAFPVDNAATVTCGPGERGPPKGDLLTAAVGVGIGASLVAAVVATRAEKKAQPKPAPIEPPIPKFTLEPKTSGLVAPKNNNGHPPMINHMSEALGQA